MYNVHNVYTLMRKPYTDAIISKWMHVIMLEHNVLATQSKPVLLYSHELMSHRKAVKECPTAHNGIV